MTYSFLVLLETTDWLLPVGIVLLLVLFIGAPSWFLLSRYIKPETTEQKKEVVSLLLQTLWGGAFLVGGWFTWQQLINSREELRNSREVLITTQQAQITERFTRAIDQLGKRDDDAPTKAGALQAPDKSLAVRLGGVYALERISRDSKGDYPAVMEVLTATVRQHVRWTGGEQVPVQPDIQAILTVLGRREHSDEQGKSQPLDLSATDLRGVVLVGTNLADANLKSVHFEDANLSNARLDRAVLIDARFNENSILTGTILRDCDLRGANLKGADVTGADFTGADLSSADLREAKGLTIAQLNSARSSVGIRTDLRPAPGP